MTAGGAIIRIRGGLEGAKGRALRKSASGARRRILSVRGGMEDSATDQRHGAHLHFPSRKFRMQHAPMIPANVSRDHFPEKMRTSIDRPWEVTGGN